MIYQKGNTLFRRFDKELLSIEPHGKNGLRVRATQSAEFNNNIPSALQPTNDNSDFEISIGNNVGYIRNGKLSCKILITGKLKFFNQKNELILEEYDKNRFRESDPSESDSALEISPRTFIPHRETNNYKLLVKFEACESEKFYGMGQYDKPFLNLKGCVLELAQRNSQITIPFTISNKGYGFLWNNPAIGRASFGRNITEWQADSTQQMDYWITAGDTPSEIVTDYTEVTGRVPMMPDYASGFWQCKLRYKSQEELLDIAREYKKRQLPLSVIVIDFFHWTAQGDWQFDPHYWPDPKGMVEELHEMGIELMVSVWPTVEEASENYQYLKENGFLIRTEAGPRMGIKNKDTYIDATNPDARDFVWQKLKKNYYDKGIRLFWLDECEPELTNYEYENYRYYVGSTKEIGNIYPREFTKMVYEGRKAEGENNILSLTRCAWAGSQKYGALVWTGDISSTFESLKNQIAAGLNMGLSGFPWWTTDIGGFHGGDPETDYFKECFIRWFQFGTFCPVFRLHGFRSPMIVEEGKKPFVAGDAEGWKYSTGSPNEVWSYGDSVYKICQKYMALREKMRPYIMKQMADAHTSGTPVMRPLFYAFPDDKRSWEIEDQYLFGPNILVAPILEYQKREREVYLPQGNWVSLFTGETFAGNQTITFKAHIDEIPVFVNSEEIRHDLIN